VLKISRKRKRTHVQLLDDSVCLQGGYSSDLRKIPTKGTALRKDVPVLLIVKKTKGEGWKKTARKLTLGGRETRILKY